MPKVRESPLSNRTNVMKNLLNKSDDFVFPIWIEIMIEDEHNHCWPSLAPLNVTAGTQKNFYWHPALPTPPRFPPQYPLRRTHGYARVRTTHTATEDGWMCRMTRDDYLGRG